MKKLAYLRTEAQVFLSMLNDMRRRLKELPPNAPTAQQYRYSLTTTVIFSECLFICFICSNVMRDVTRLLYLLNKKPSAIEVPPDGVQLLAWSEQILQRYLASQVSHLEQQYFKIVFVNIYFHKICSGTGYIWICGTMQTLHDKLSIPQRKVRKIVPKHAAKYYIVHMYARDEKLCMCSLKKHTTLHNKTLYTYI